MRDDVYNSSASLKEYVVWIGENVLNLPGRELNKYSKLFTKLAEMEFVWLHPRDENRAKDGLKLRREFTNETDLDLDSSSGILPKCTVFEMLAGLARRCEDQLMHNLSYGNRTSEWFFIMIDNLGLSGFTNKNWDSDTDDDIFNAVHTFLYRKYKINGFGGGLFPIKKRGVNQKTEEIWKQMMTFLSENYTSEDDSELELYKKR